MTNDHFHYLKLAKTLNQKFCSLLLSHPAPFRGSLNSMTLVSLRLESPQLKIKKRLPGTEDRYDVEYIMRLLNHPNLQKAPARNTPEKRVQSFVIHQALQNAGRLNFKPSVKFVTDEFARTEKGKDVADIFGFDTETETFVLLELKYARKQKDLINQLNKAADGVNADPQFYEELLAVHGYAWKGPSKIQKMVIWPGAASRPCHSFPKDFEVYAYQPCGDDSYVIDFVPQC